VVTGLNFGPPVTACPPNSGVWSAADMGLVLRMGEFLNAFAQIGKTTCSLLNFRSMALDLISFYICNICYKFAVCWIPFEKSYISKRGVNMYTLH